MKKVMHFIHGLNTGGAETLVKNYMLMFDNREFDAVLLCLSHEPGSPYEKELRERGVRVIYVQDLLPFRERSGFLGKAANRYCRYLVVRKIIRKEKPDILHTHLPINSFVKFARPKATTVIFHTVHNEPTKLLSNII